MNSIHGSRATHSFQSSHYFHALNSIDDTDASSRKSSLDSLSELQIGIHSGGGIGKPGHAMLHSRPYIFFITGDQVSGCKSSDNPAEADHGQTMRYKIIGVGK